MDTHRIIDNKPLIIENSQEQSYGSTLQKLIEFHRLELKNGWYVQTPPGGSPWKVFRKKDAETKGWFWAFFRLHKLCSAKYIWFSQYIDHVRPFITVPSFIYTEVPKTEDWIRTEGFFFPATQRFLTFTALQKIADKQVFLDTVNTCADL